MSYILKQLETQCSPLLQTPNSIHFLKSKQQTHDMQMCP